MLGRLGSAARDAREDAGLSQTRIVVAVDVYPPPNRTVLSRFENGQRWPNHVEEIVEAYERECGLPDGELWRRAISQEGA
jgi:transcriptional regulator with XRE-family HTH domain